MGRRGSGDSGQAFPVYIAVVAGLLFLAFAYFLVGQAASTRNSAQTAADAAALAAAQEAREQLWHGWVEAILEPGQWNRFLQGVADTGASPCQQAEKFAARNEAVLTGSKCVPLATEEHGFKVTVRTTGREPRHATASAEAVLEPRCTFDAPEPTSDPSEPAPDSTPTPPAEDDGESDDEEPIVGLVCDGKQWVIDLDNPSLPGAADLFRVRLSD
ncbi:pilus assembly protein TadG-related protein [Streptomyces globisporus]|uniref:pilus assembly protein TadG-related protein n=1 Tax=Streptomyces globisporus TaxID=1908 RepID=UPI0004C7A171|nr:pilus assembly protein TadG-related protein [Streptomyces globisporus]